MKTCGREGCVGKHHALGLCGKHYKQALAGGQVTRPWVRQEPECSVDGCNQRPKAKGLCSTHHSRQYRHGNPLVNPGRGRKGYGVPVSPPTSASLILPTDRYRPCTNCGETVLVVPGLHSGDIALDLEPCADGNVVISSNALCIQWGIRYAHRMAAVVLAPYVLAALADGTPRYRLHAETCATANLSKHTGRAKRQREFMADVRGWGRAS